MDFWGCSEQMGWWQNRNGASKNCACSAFKKQGKELSLRSRICKLWTARRVTDNSFIVWCLQELWRHITLSEAPTVAGWGLPATGICNLQLLCISFSPSLFAFLSAMMEANLVNVSCFINPSVLTVWELPFLMLLIVVDILPLGTSWLLHATNHVFITSEMKPSH